MTNNYRPVYLGEMCTEYKMRFRDALESDFLEFKKVFVDKLEFVDAQMVKMYEVAFFCNFFGFKAEKLLKNHRFNRKVFQKALSEVKKAYTRKEPGENFVCNLYSVTNGLS